MITKSPANLQLLEAALGFEDRDSTEGREGPFGVGPLDGPEDSRLIPPAKVDIARFSPRKRDPGIWRFVGIETHPVIIYVGRLTEELNVDVLVDAFQCARDRGIDASLAIVGDGPCLEALQSRSLSDDIHFLGDYQGEMLAKLISSADLLVCPGGADAHEGRVLEAQAAGVPAIVGSRGPMSRIAAGRTGFVVPSGDVETLAFAIAKLCLDDNLRKAYGAAGRNRALDMAVDEPQAAYLA